VPFNRGENDRRTVYNDLGLLLRDAEHIEKFRDADQHPAPGTGGLFDQIAAGDRGTRRTR
jgi:hypothetical protein